VFTIEDRARVREQCGRLDVKLADGTMHSAYFKFVK
jgi:hypothetical protein